MGVLLKLIDAILFVFFIMMATAPIVDWQLIMPQSFFPKWMVEYKNWYIGEFGDILYVEKPHFFIGQLWLELVFQWPLCLANLYGVLAGKSWYTTTCLVYGTTILTATVSAIAVFIGTGKASNQLMSVYYPCLGLCLLAMLRGLLRPSVSTTTHAAKEKRI